MFGQPGRGQGGFSRRGGAQAVIDDERQHGAGLAAGPAIGEPRQRHAIGAAGDRDGQMRRRAERAEAGECGRESGLNPLPGRRAQWQAALLRAPAMLSFRSARGVGNSARSLSSVAQAARFSFSAVSELARPTSASWACAPVRLLL